MHPGRRPVALMLLVGVLTVVVASATACSKQPKGVEADANGHVSVYVTSKVVPQGMLVATARNNGAFELKALPADVAGQDPLTSLDGLDCLVAGQSLPAGTVVRRNQLVTPQSVGLDRGLTGDTAPRPPGC